MLEVRDLEKRFGKVVAVDRVSFAIRAGEMLGLLGPNGAGKTTTVSIIAGLLHPDGGQVQICGRQLASDTDPLKHKLGLVPQDVALYEELSARENLCLFGALYDLKGRPLERAMAAALELVGLADRARDKVAGFSGGMKRRLNLAAALLHDPEILLLDEPTVGVDPQSRNAIFDNLAGLKKQGKTLLYTTHYMEEAERLCDRIVIIDHGRVIADDTLRGLYRRLPVANRLIVELEGPGDEAWVGRLRALPGVEAVELRDGTLTVGLKELAAGAPRVLEWLVQNDHPYQHVVSERANLETVFLTLTGRRLRD